MAPMDPRTEATVEPTPTDASARGGSEAQTLLTAYLADHDVPCPCCQYNLRGLTGARCPECGEQLELTIARARPGIKAMITGLIGLTIGLGMHGFLLAGILIHVASSAAPLRITMPVLGVFIAFAALLAATTVWLAQWDRIASLPTYSRFTFAFTCWAVMLSIATITFMVFAR